MTSLMVKLIADFQTTLALKVAVGATTGTLTSGLDADGVQLPTGTYGFTVDRNNANKEYFTATVTGSALTDVKTVTRGDGVGTSGFVRAHRKGAEVIISDWVALRRMMDVFDGTTGFDADTPLTYDGVPTFTDDNSLVTKQYADAIAVAGGADASTSTKGITKMSVAPASAANPIAVGDNDPRVPSTGENDALAGTSGTPSSSNKYVTNDDTSATSSANKVYRQTAAGKIDATMLIGNLPALDGSALTGTFTKKCGATSKDVSDASGTQTIAHGLGRTPKFVKLTAKRAFGSGAYNVWNSISVYDGTTQASLSDAYQSANPLNSVSTSFVLADAGFSSASQTGVITFDGTNISIAWTKSGSPTGTYQIIWEAEG